MDEPNAVNLKKAGHAKVDSVVGPAACNVVVEADFGGGADKRGRFKLVGYFLREGEGHGGRANVDGVLAKGGSADGENLGGGGGERGRGERGRQHTDKSVNGAVGGGRADNLADQGLGDDAHRGAGTNELNEPGGRSERFVVVAGGARHSDDGVERDAGLVELGGVANK